MTHYILTNIGDECVGEMILAAIEDDAPALELMREQLISAQELSADTSDVRAWPQSNDYSLFNPFGLVRQIL